VKVGDKRPSFTLDLSKQYARLQAKLKSAALAEKNKLGLIWGLSSGFKSGDRFNFFEIT
jgi:hypothetical protein